MLYLSRERKATLLAVLSSLTRLVLGWILLLNVASAQVAKIPVASPMPEVNATAWALMDYESGWIVAGDNVLSPLPPASITKLMTNYVVFEQLRAGSIQANELVSISEKAWRAEGSRMFADVNSSIELNPLLKSTVIQSGNDASIALAEHIAGNEADFALIMNRAARKLGLSQTNFKNSTGLPAQDHVMSARDIAKLSAAIIREFPDYYSWYSEKEYTHNGITQYNRNKLLWRDDSVDGLKTGYTEEAGFCLVGSAKRADQRWIAVVLGANSAEAREKAVSSILDYGFTNLESLSLIGEAKTVAVVPVYKGDSRAIEVVASTNIDVVIPQGRAKDVEKVASLPEYIEAPIEAGQILGSLSVRLDNQELYNVPLLSKVAVTEGGFWSVLTDTAELKWKEFLN